MRKKGAKNLWKSQIQCRHSLHVKFSIFSNLLKISKVDSKIRKTCYTYTNYLLKDLLSSR